MGFCQFNKLGLRVKKRFLRKIWGSGKFIKENLGFLIRLPTLAKVDTTFLCSRLAMKAPVIQRKPNPVMNTYL